LLKNKTMTNIYTDSVFQDDTNISLNIDVIRLSNKLDSLMLWVKEQENIAVKEERFSDAIKWRDFPSHGIVKVDSLDMKTFYII